MGWFLDYQRPIIIVDDFNLDLDRVYRHFVRLGYDAVTGVSPEDSRPGPKPRRT